MISDEPGATAFSLPVNREEYSAHGFKGEMTSVSVGGSPSVRRPSLFRLAGDSTSVRQAIKIGIAGAVTAYLADALKLPQGFWAVITAMIVVTQSNLGTAVTASRDQLAGAAIGATVGAVSTAIWGAGILVFGTAVTIAVVLSTVLGLRNSYPMAGFNVAIVMIVPHLDTPWTFALHRFLEVALGAVVALVVTTVVWPSRAYQRARRGMAEYTAILFSWLAFATRILVGRCRRLGG